MKLDFSQARFALMHSEHTITSSVMHPLASSKDSAGVGEAVYSSNRRWRCVCMPTGQLSETLSFSFLSEN